MFFRRFERRICVRYTILASGMYTLSKAAEFSFLFKKKGQYVIYNIAMQTEKMMHPVIVHRADLRSSMYFILC